jgi:hypothetical protein
MKVILPKEVKKQIIIVAFFLASIIVTWILFGYRIDVIDSQSDPKIYPTR